MLRRRLTAPGPTRLRTEVSAENDDDTGSDTVVDMGMGEVSPDEARLALVTTKSQSPAPILNGTPSSHGFPEISSRWLTIGIFVAKVILLIGPCSPYICSPRIFWPLLGLAVLDLVGYFIGNVIHN